MVDFVSKDINTDTGICTKTHMTDFNVLLSERLVKYFLSELSGTIAPWLYLKNSDINDDPKRYSLYLWVYI